MQQASATRTRRKHRSSQGPKGHGPTEVDMAHDLGHGRYPERLPLLSHALMVRAVRP
jgi:hypothetical protein